ncbi:MAG TPA: FecR family protein [Chitinispirillaceae bacterium]|nr:FecR family protein [Chitinispirillaceae bacterium]
MIKTLIPVIVTALFLSICFAQNNGLDAAKIQLIQGSADVYRSASGKGIVARIGMCIRVGDTLRSREESFVEVLFINGEIIRLDENSTLVIERADSQKAESSLPAGRVWVNMKKIVSHRAFDVSTPTAVAAIRGTIYDMRAGDDQSVDVHVYDGKVAVGPSADLKKKLQGTPANKPAGGEPTQVPGPTEIQGPHEVTLEQWQTIVAGMRIKIAPEGAFTTTKFEKIEKDTFVSQNISLDRNLR